jgi:hypothetical protein
MNCLRLLPLLILTLSLILRVAHCFADSDPGIDLAKKLLRSSQTSPDSSLAVKESQEVIEISNGLIMARFERQASGIHQEFFARSRSGAQWQSVVKSFRLPDPRPSGTAPLYSDTDVANEYRLLVANALDHMKIAARNKQQVRVLLSGRLRGNAIQQLVMLGEDKDHFHIEVEGLLEKDPPKVEYLLSTFVFQQEGPLDFSHAPAMKRAADNVFADRVFHSPAIVLQKNGLCAALVPDLDSINKDFVYAKGVRQPDGHRGFRVSQDPAKMTLPAALDLDVKSGLTPAPLFSYGLMDYVVEQHVYWRHENKDGVMVRELSGRKLYYEFDLFVRSDAPRNRGYQRVTRFLWERYGTAHFREPRPQAMPFAEYARVCFPAAFEYRGDTLDDTKRYSASRGYKPDQSGPLNTWLEFDFEGKPVGGIRATPSQWYNDIQFMAWWNNVRDAVGMYWWGQRGVPDLGRKARLILNLVLSAPQNQGIFPSVFNQKEKRWFGCYWKPEPPYNPKILPKYWDFNSDYYQTAGVSKTGVHLLRYYHLCEKDQRILPFVRRYGDFLIEHLDPNGCVPAWFTSDLKPVEHLRFNGEGGIHLWFLTELYKATQESKYLSAARKIAQFMRLEILPQQRWYDFETFYSCASKPEATFDPHTGQWPRCTLSMMWAIEGFSSLYEATQNREDLDTTEAVADYANFYQSVWQPHFIITAYAFGGFTSQNSDAEWLDMRQSQLGEALVRLGRLTGRQDLLERGVAAVRSSFALIKHPRHIQNGIFPTPSYPLGISPENIDHEGLPQLPLRSGFDWGEGGALAAAATLLDQLGGFYVDPKTKLAVGVDGVFLKSFRIEGRKIHIELENQLAALTVPYELAYQIDLRIPGLPPGQYEVTVNSENPRTVSNADLDRWPMVVKP